MQLQEIHRGAEEETASSEGEELSVEELEAARTDQEGGAKWWFEETERALSGDVGEGSPIDGVPSQTPISDAAFNLIVEFEVSSKSLYEQRYRGAIWPGAHSGVTIGIGYDVGYVSKEQLKEDWQGHISDAMLNLLVGTIGKTGAAGKRAAQPLEGKIDVPWEAAIRVHRQKVIPRWIGLVERALPNTSQLSKDALGALVSLTYNRGASFRKDGERYREMRAIRLHMVSRHFHKIPAELRSMRRLWPTLKGLQIRREREAGLFERGL